MRIEKPLQIEHDGARLFAVTVGSGPDIVLLHPTPVHHAFWRPVADRLADRYRLTLIDLRGHGQSSAGTGTITMARMAEDVHAILAASGIQRAAFVGCSIGTYTLYEYWRRFPQQMAALVCTCGKPQPDSEANRDTRRESMQAARANRRTGKVLRSHGGYSGQPDSATASPRDSNRSAQYDGCRVPAGHAGRAAGFDGAARLRPNTFHHRYAHMCCGRRRRPEQHPARDARDCRPGARYGISSRRRRRPLRSIRAAGKIRIPDRCISRSKIPAREP